MLSIRTGSYEGLRLEGSDDIRVMRNIIYILTLLVVAAVSSAAEPSVTFDVQPRVIRMGESATATLTFQGMENPANPGFPNIAGFRVQGAGTETSLRIEDGKQTSAVTSKYRLIPERAGKTTIGPFTYDDGKGHKFELAGVTIEVLDATATETGAQQPLFAKLEPSTTNLYVQQVFDLVLKVYVSSRLNLHQLGPLQNLPAQGLVIHQPQQIDTQREAIEGEIYNVYRFRLKAQSITAGRYDLAPVQRAELATQRKTRRGPFGDDFFDSFFGGVQTEGRDIAVQPFTLVIKDLPAKGRPPTFAGAVGRYAFDMTAKPLELSAGDPITLNFRISGRGNVDSVQMPSLALGDAFKTYDPKLTAQNVDPQAAAGEKTFEQVIIPKSENARLIPEVTFAYFDPEKEAYQTIRRGPFELTVHPPSRDLTSLIVEQHSAATDGSQKAEMLGADIIYLKPAPASWRSTGGRPWYAHPVAKASQAVPALAVAAAFLLIRRREKLAGDIAKSRRQLAPRAARAGIARAQEAIRANDAAQFYDALWEAMASYFGNRLNLAPGDVTADRIDAAFASASFDEKQRNLVMHLFASCEQARFGGMPAFDPDASNRLIAGLEDALRACEKVRL